MKRICSKCGNELKKGEKFCPRCGERCPILEEKEESKKLNKNKFVIAIVIVLLVVIGVSKVHSGKVEKSEKYDEASQLAQMAQAEEDEKQEIQEQIYQTIDSAILPMTQLTVGQAITTVFSDYDIKWESYDSSNTKYEVTCTHRWNHGRTAFMLLIICQPVHQAIQRDIRCHNRASECTCMCGKNV